MALKGMVAAVVLDVLSVLTSAVGDVLHFHFAQGYRLDVMYFVSTSESDTLILDMNHDGDSFTKETW